MPDIGSGRQKVLSYLKEHNVKKSTLASSYGYERQEVTNILNGSTKGPRANTFILRVIEDFGIK